MQLYKGVVQDRVVVLTEGVHLQEGMQVEVQIRETGQRSLEELFRKCLVGAGLLERIRKPSQPLAGQDRTPIQVKGKPLSE